MNAAQKEKFFVFKNERGQIVLLHREDIKATAEAVVEELFPDVDNPKELISEEEKVS